MKAKFRKIRIGELAVDVALLTTINLLNRFLDKEEKPIVKRAVDEERLNRKLNMVSLVYHAIGIFYNE